MEPTLPSRPIELKTFNGAVEKLVEWDTKADKLFSKLNTVETQECIAAGLLEELDKLPDAAPWETDVKKKSFRASLIDADPKKEADLVAAAARYASLVKSLRDKMAARVKANAPQQA